MQYFAEPATTKCSSSFATLINSHDWSKRAQTHINSHENLNQFKVDDNYELMRDDSCPFDQALRA